MPRDDLTAARVRKLLRYDGDTGDFTWIVGRGSRTPGTRTSAAIKHGYMRVKIDGAHYFAHRLAWLYVHGSWPLGQIDHIDGNTLNNRLSNLRITTVRVNQQNRRTAQRTSRTGLMGVGQSNSKRNPWHARITVDSKLLHLGVFLTPEQAHEAYLKAKRMHHEGCTI